MSADAPPPDAEGPARADAPLPYDPYAAPREDAAVEGPRGHGTFRGAYVKWIYLALEASRFAAVVPTHFVDLEPNAWQVVNVFDRGSALAASLVGVWWVWTACSALPVRALVTANLSPGGAVGMLFVPCYNLFWIFAVHFRLCSALDDALAHVGKTARRLHPLAMAAVAIHLAASGVAVTQDPRLILIASLVTGTLWFAYMLGFDSALRALDAASHGERGA